MPATTAAQQASAALVSSGPPALTYIPSASWWGTNGRVSDIKVVGNRVYIAGGFDYLGRTTGYGVRVTPTDGKLSASPRVDGIVRAAIPDGSGGWYIGGDFRKVDTKGRVTLAHITSTGAVGTWNPKTDGTVNALALTPAGVAIGGSFSSVNGVAAQNLAVVDKAAGATVATWRASANLPVLALAASGTGLYVGGDFTSLNGQSRSSLARLNASTGATDPGFAGTANGAVRALAVDAASTTLYAGGDFTSATGSGSATRSRLAAFDLTTGALEAFAPAADRTVQALALDSSGRLYAGGLFASVGRRGTGPAGPDPPHGQGRRPERLLSGCHMRHDKKYAHGLPPCTPEVSGLSVSGTTLYVGGRFGASGSAQRHNAAAFSVNNGALTAWNPVAGDRPLAVASSSGGVYLGGEFTSVGGLVRRGLAVINATTGAGDSSFQADANEYVEAMVASKDGSRLFVGGNFTQLQGKARTYLAAIDVATGIVVDTFSPVINKSVLTVAYSSGAVYAGGQFTKVGGISGATRSSSVPPAGRWTGPGSRTPRAHRERCDAAAWWRASRPPRTARRCSSVARSTRSTARPSRAGSPSSAVRPGRSARQRSAGCAAAARWGPGSTGSTSATTGSGSTAGTSAGRHLPVGRRQPLHLQQPDGAEVADLVQCRHAGPDRGQRPLLLRHPRRRPGWEGAA